ncbi:DUF859 family phage minor structural protein [Halobacillus rhizosphaerae]|uniref:DUF859 family phage minor structural protein n=1 Tax=Halobacillus rhizosphaerae TaxID=3064889 RepID=UPI00398B1352
MALSGSFYTNVNSHWGLRLNWSATQSISNNQSTITAKLYWIAEDGYGSVHSSATKDGSVTIDGSSSSFSGSGLASLNSNQTKLIKTYSKTVTHDSDGSKSVSLSAYFDVELTLNGTYYGRVSVSGTAKLNDIPRNSTIASSVSWVAGERLDVNISRASSSFRHSIKVYVNDVFIKRVDDVNLSYSIGFDTAETTEIFNQLNTSSSVSAKLDVLTYNGSDYLGYTSKTGSVSSANSSTTTQSVEFNIGDSLAGIINKENDDFTHTVQLIFSGTTYTLFTKSSVTNWSYNTSSIASSLYSKTPNSTSMVGTLRIYTYYNNEQVRSYRDYYMVANVTNSEPTFTSSQFSYSDSNSTITAITGNNQYIVQNLSNFRFTLNSLATAKNSASIMMYVITINGDSRFATATGNIDFGAISASSNLILSVKVIDSRGLTTTAMQYVNIIPYSPPKIVASATRLNNFEPTTTFSLSGSFSLLNINGVNKNSITNTHYRYKERSSGTWSSYVSFTRTTSGNTYNTTDLTRTLDNLKAYDIEFRVIDKFNTVTLQKVVTVGKPLYFMDTVKNSIGVNKFPINSNSFEIEGSMMLNNTTLATNSDGSLKVSNSNGYVEIAPKNSSYAHFQTDRPQFYFYKPVTVNGNLTVLGDGNVNNLLFGSGMLVSGTTTTGSNVDHIWHDDSSNTWYFVSDGSPKSDPLTSGGDSNIKANYYKGFRYVNIGSAHGFNEFYVRGENGSRSGWYGYGSPNTTDFAINNSLGDIRLTTNGAGDFIFQSTTGDGHMTLQGAPDRARIKWVGSGVQIRKPDDSTYDTLRAIISDASDRRLKSNIELVEDYFIERIRNAPVYMYNLEKDLSKKYLGIMTDEAPWEIVLSGGEDDYDGINLYAMCTFLWKAVQELSYQIEHLNHKIARK